MVQLRLVGIIVFSAVFVSSLGCSSCTETHGLTDQDEQLDADIGEDAADEDVGDADDVAQGADTGDADVGEADDCAADRWCDDECCADDELCLSGGCSEPGDECSHSLECPDDHFCERRMGNCLPEADGTCEYIPDDDAFDPVVEDAWSADSDSDVPMPTYNQVMMAPAVVDITEDGTPNIVFSTFQGSDYNGPSVLRAIDGATYEPIFDLTDSDQMVAGSASVAIGDIDGDGRNEIVAVGPNSDGIVVFDDHTTDWEVKWRDDGFSASWDGAYLADLDGNGDVEVVIVNRVYDGESGELLCENGDVSATPRNSVTADLNGDGSLEIVGSNGAFEFQRDADGTVDCPTYWTFDDMASSGGYPAVADFGTFNEDEQEFGQFDGHPEVAVVTYSAERTVRLYDGQTGDEIWAKPMPVDDHPQFSSTQCVDRAGGGPPTVADFTGDGYPDVATAGACYYAIFDMHGEIIWEEATQDLSSRVTGSSVFDFQGNGRAEAVYADECFLRVYDGAGDGDGSTEELFKIANTTGTTRELPVIVDVDGDFHTDIVLIGNDYSGVTNRCSSEWEDFDDLGGSSRGIRVVRDSENRWVSSRQVWNQHAYSVTNVCDGLDDSLCPGVDNKPGAIPSGRENNWDVDHLNNYRQNVQGEGLFYAPDLTVTDIDGQCRGDVMDLEVTVANEGSRGVPEGLEVAVFVEVDGDEELEVVVETTEFLPPGGKETVVYEWEEAPISTGDGEEVEIAARADDDGTGSGQYPECNEDNNDRTSIIECPCTTGEYCDEGEYCATGLCQEIQG